MNIKQFKARYAELNPDVLMTFDEKTLRQCKLSEIPTVYDHFENIRYSSIVDDDGKYLFRVWANVPASHYLPAFYDYDEPVDYFMAYCNSMDYKFISLHNIDDNFYLLNMLDNEEHTEYIDLFFVDLDNCVDDAILLASCDKNDVEADLLIKAFRTLSAFKHKQNDRIAKLRSKDISCSGCDCYDPDMGCTMPSIDRSYACPKYSNGGET